MRRLSDEEPGSSGSPDLERGQGTKACRRSGGRPGQPAERPGRPARHGQGLTAPSPVLIAGKTPPSPRDVAHKLPPGGRRVPDLLVTGPASPRDGIPGETS